MGVQELWYRLETIPDFSLSKYSALPEQDVAGVLEQHLSFLRQWNRKGILSGVSIHLFYYYDGQNKQGEYGVGEKGSQLEVLVMVRGQEEKMANVPNLISSSALSAYFSFLPTSYQWFLEKYHLEDTVFSVCSTLLKKEVFVPSSIDEPGENGGYYTIAQWEASEDGRLYNMSKLMESLDQQMLYRVDLYPTERGASLRSILRRTMGMLRQRQYAKAGAYGQRDFEAENTLKGYEDLLEQIDSSPHFIANLFLFGHDAENTAVVLDAAGAEAIEKGTYEIATMSNRFTAHSFFDTESTVSLVDRRKKILLQSGNLGLVACHEDALNYKMRYLPTLFTLEEIAPFFRFPALFEGEVIQKRKETAPKAVAASGGLYLGQDDNGYEVYFPLKNLSKHAFIAGVPGSGKTNTMLHLTSSLWKEHNIPFLVLEPAKQEYRALANQKGMEDLHIFAPNADMTFPLHINPFEFPKGLMLAEHIRKLVSVFEGAFPLDNPMPFLLDTAIEAVYRDLGWRPDMVYTENTKLKFPTMSMLYKRLEEELKITSYSEEIRGNLESALKVRIGSLLRREMGDVFDVPNSSIAPERWMEIPAVIELESMGTGPANFLTLMLCTLIRESLKVNPRYPKEHARHVIFIEEAHNLIGPQSEEVSGGEGDAKQAATAFIVKMLAEVRALKESIVIADQLPTVMAQEVLKNTGLKVGLRITSADDRSLLGSTMAANGVQMEAMATFEPGHSIVSYEGLMRPFTMQTHMWGGRRRTNHCTKTQRDVAWCPGCVHYQTGCCEPDDQARNAMPISKTDEDLAHFLQGNLVYQSICQKSFQIEATKINQDLKLLLDSVQEMRDHVKKINAKELELRQLEEAIEAQLRILGAQGSWSREQPLPSDVQEAIRMLEKERMELETGLKSSKNFKKVYETIVECINMANRIELRKGHWAKLGIQGLMDGRIEDNPPLLQQMVQGVGIMQKTVLNRAQDLFLADALHLKNADAIRSLLQRAVATYHGQWVLS